MHSDGAWWSCQSPRLTAYSSLLSKSSHALCTRVPMLVIVRELSTGIQMVVFTSLSKCTSRRAPLYGLYWYVCDCIGYVCLFVCLGVHGRWLFCIILISWHPLWREGLSTERTNERGLPQKTIHLLPPLFCSRVCPCRHCLPTELRLFFSVYFLKLLVFSLDVVNEAMLVW